MTFETFDQSDEETWPDQQKDNDKDKYKDKDSDKDNDKDNTFREHLHRENLDTWDRWDTDYIPDNWEPEFMTIFVTWQLRVTRDSIRNSCDVYIYLGLMVVFLFCFIVLQKALKEKDFFFITF